MGLSLFPPAVRVLKDLSSYFAAFVSVSSFNDHVLIFWTASLSLIHLALTNALDTQGCSDAGISCWPKYTDSFYFQL